MLFTDLPQQGELREVIGPSATVYFTSDNIVRFHGACNVCADNCYLCERRICFECSYGEDDDQGEWVRFCECGTDVCFGTLDNRKVCKSCAQSCVICGSVLAPACAIRHPCGEVICARDSCARDLIDLLSADVIGEKMSLDCDHSERSNA